MSKKRIVTAAAVLACLGIMVSWLVIRSRPQQTAPVPAFDSRDTAASTARTGPLQPSRGGDTVPDPHVTPTRTTSPGIRSTAAAPNMRSAETPPAVAATEPADPCDADTSIPWAYPDPSGGLFRQQTAVVLRATEQCEIEWRRQDDTAWHLYRRGDSIVLTRSTTLLLRARDSCGNTMDERGELYEIRPNDSARRYCPADMAYIKISETRFCIDRFEWPNVRGTVPHAYVSLYEAMDSCASKGKRLCTSDEWLLACSGPYGWNYPYGARYEPRACVTRDRSVQAAGSRVECRGWFGIFDMSGNLLEWTATRSIRNPRFYNVMGGFWESGSRSGCRHVRHSYFPQNRHNPVGFRCCSDINDQQP